MATKKVKIVKSSSLNEPSDAFGKKRVSFFSSIKEQQIENYKWLASLTPEENLCYATQMIKRVFAKELKEYPTIGNRVKFGD